ncbi:MAG: MBG domain-containing protein, partial [Paludibacter sp.]
SSTNATSVNVATVSSSVAAKALTITANNVNKTYGTALSGAAGSTAFTSSALANSETIGSVTIAYGTGAAANAAVNTYSTSAVVPSAAIGVSFTASNYNITYVDGNIIVTAKALIITANNKTVTHGTAAFKVTDAGTYSVTGFVNSETASVIGGSVSYSTNYTNATAVDASGISITPIVTGLTSPNYSFTPAAGTITISAATTIVTAPVGATNLSALSTDVSTDIVVPSTGVLAVNSSPTVNSVTVNAGGILTVASPLTIGTVIFKAGKEATASATPSAYTFSTKLDANITATTVRVYKTIDDLKWYFMSFPCDVTISQITKSDGSTLGTLGAGGDWFIKYYDGQNRATNGPGSNWKHIALAPDPTKLLANHGYIFGLNTVGATYEVEMSIPLASSVLSAESDGRTVPVTAFTGTAGGTNNGWNLVGQPYMSNFNGNGKTTAAFMSFPDGNNATYTPISNGENYYITPMGAYFVQVGSGTTITFDKLGRQGVKSTVAIDLSDRVQLNFASATGTDKTNLIMDNTQSTAYEIGQDFEKMIGTGTDKPQVYSMLGGINYAYNALPMSSVTNLPIGIYTKTAGSTTISVDATQAP